MGGVFGVGGILEDIGFSPFFSCISPRVLCLIFMAGELRDMRLAALLSGGKWGWIGGEVGVELGGYETG